MLGLYTIWIAFCITFFFLMRQEEMLRMERAIYGLYLAGVILLIYACISVICLLFVRFLMPFYEKRDTSRYKIY